MPKLHSFHRFRALIVCGLLVLVCGSIAFEMKPVLTWPSLGANDSLRVENREQRALFSSDGKIVARVDGDTVVVQDVASGRERVLRGGSLPGFRGYRRRRRFDWYLGRRPGRIRHSAKSLLPCP